MSRITEEDSVSIGTNRLSTIQQSLKNESNDKREFENLRSNANRFSRGFDDQTRIDKYIDYVFEEV